jgi:FAD/FMN-containing dehydrogenase
VCRSGGHSTAGYSVLDDSMVIDLKQMNRIEVVPDERIARIEAGASFHDVNFEYSHFRDEGTPSPVSVSGAEHRHKDPNRAQYHIRSQLIDHDADVQKRLSIECFDHRQANE